MEAIHDWSPAYILRQKKLRLTDNRRQILQVIQQASCSIGLPELEQALPYIDRITVYRTLQSFRQKNIIHMVTDPASGASRYVFSRPEFAKPHAHFKCGQCGMLTCMKDGLPADGLIPLPSGYRAYEYSVVIQGLCNTCNR